MASYQKDMKDLQVRLRRIEGQVRGLQRMVQEEQYCVDILTQISSVRRATEKVGLMILRDHIQGCVAESFKEDGDPDRVDELVQVVERFLKT